MLYKLAVANKNGWSPTVRILLREAYTWKPTVTEQYSGPFKRGQFDKNAEEDKKILRRRSKWLKMNVVFQSLLRFLYNTEWN